MDMMLQAVSYLGIRARNLGRAVFGNEAGALTLEWIVIAVALVAAAGIAVGFFDKKIRALVKGL
jgi:hypothetical protein